MLCDLFPRDHRRYEQLPFGPDIEAFAGWLTEHGHLRHPLRLHLRRAKYALEHARRASMGPKYDEVALQKAFIVDKREAYLYLCTGRIFIRFLKDTDRLASTTPNDALSQLRRRYQRYIVEVRGLSTASQSHHGFAVSDFLARGLPPSGRLRDLTRDDVESYVRTKSKENSRASLQHVIAYLRAFLCYCVELGEARAGVELIDTPRVYRGELPPRALDWTTVRRLLASIRRRSPRDWRDYTVLHLMVHYGLRASEIANLRVDAIDLDARVLRVDQCKTRSELILPLADRTVRLLRRYLQVARPDSGLPQLFLRVRSPIAALRNHGVIEIFHFRIANCGLNLKGVSSYALRHAFAMRLLQRGVGIKAIGDLLGHRSLEATCVYLRLDTNALRSVALPIPELSTHDGGGSNE